MKLKSVLAAPYRRLRGYRPLRVPVAAWDQQFRTGQWKYLDADINQIGGLGIVFSYCRLLGPAAVLDVGCGAGSLTKTLRLLNYQYYLGIDVSAEAIAQAKSSYADHRTNFTTAPAETFETAEKFDVIVFNQCAYYFERPDAVIRRYVEFLSAAGRIIVSMSDDPRTRAAWKLILKDMTVEHWIRIVQADGSATTTLLRPR